MKFLDANVFIYAYYKPKRSLTPKEQLMKNEAKEIINKINEGKEEITTTVIHIAETVNILKQGMPPDTLINMVIGFFMLDNVKIIGDSREMYFAAAELGRDLKLDPNDALIVEVMRSNDIKELYSFDKDFEKIEGITRLPIT